jgi:hypothetical protein
MDAPNEHWQLVKDLWMPIENELSLQGAIGKDAVEKIDSMRGRLSATHIDYLHYLRMDRNGVIHSNRAMNNAVLWESRAKECLAALQSAPKRMITINCTGIPAGYKNPDETSFFWRAFPHGLGFLVVGWLVALFIEHVKPSAHTPVNNQSSPSLKPNSQTVSVDKHKMRRQEKPQINQNSPIQEQPAKPEVMYIKIND